MIGQGFEQNLGILLDTSSNTVKIPVNGYVWFEVILVRLLVSYGEKGVLKPF